MTDDPSIRRIEIPTPFAIGPVNAYLIEDEPLTLIDCGPAWALALQELENSLAVLGHRIEEIELVLLTHQHVDHLGLAEFIASRSGAEVASLEILARYAETFETSMDEDDDAAAKLMADHGVAAETVTVVRSHARTSRHWGAPVTVGRRLENGSSIDLRDRSLQVVHAPGHSPTDTVFVDGERRIAFFGDHLLAEISSNALVASRPPGAPRHPRYPALRTYLDSLRLTASLEIELGLAGHVPPIEDHRSLIEQRMVEHEERAAQILSLIRDSPRSAHEIARKVWGDSAAITQAHLTTSEVLGHVDLLIERGLVVENTDGPVVEFSAC